MGYLRKDTKTQLGEFGNHPVKFRPTRTRHAHQSPSLLLHLRSSVSVLLIGHREIVKGVVRGGGGRIPQRSPPPAHRRLQHPQQPPPDFSSASKMVRWKIINFASSQPADKLGREALEMCVCASASILTLFSTLQMSPSVAVLLLLAGAVWSAEASSQFPLSF